MNRFYESSFTKGFEYINGKVKNQFYRGVELESDGKKVEGMTLDNGRVRRLHFDLPSYDGPQEKKKIRKTPHPHKRRRTAPRRKGLRRSFRRIR